MSRRLIDLLCARHRSTVLDTRCWPADKCGENSWCMDCYTGHAILLPHLNSREQLAIHEAGHAVVHLLCGTRIDHAFIESGDIANMRNPGGVHLDSESYPAKALMAGAAAVELWATRWAYPIDNADLIDIACGAVSDFDIAWKCGLTVEDAGRALREADDDVATHWSAVERVAEALLSSSRLSGAEIAAIARIEAAA